MAQEQKITTKEIIDYSKIAKKTEENILKLNSATVKWL